MSGPASYDWLYTAGAWLLAGIGALVLLLALFRDRSRGRRRCPKCWYDMTGIPGLKCPECGWTARHERQLFRTRRRWGRAAAGVLLLLAAGLVSAAPALQRGWPAAVPGIVLALMAPTERPPTLNVAISGFGGATSLTVPQMLAREFWDRLTTGRVPRWQSQIYFARWFRDHPCDPAASVVLPERWPAGEPILATIGHPATNDPTPAPLPMFIRHADLACQTIDGRVAGLLGVARRPVDRLTLHFELRCGSATVYSRSFTEPIRVTADRAGLLDQVADPEASARVRRALDPRLEWTAAGPSLTCRNRTPAALAAAGGELDFLVAFTAEVRLDGETLARTPAARSWGWIGSGPRFEVPLDWASGAQDRAAADRGRLVIVFTGDAAAAGAAYMQAPFTTRPACWAGRFEVGAGES